MHDYAKMYKSRIVKHRPCCVLERVRRVLRSKIPPELMVMAIALIVAGKK